MRKRVKLPPQKHGLHVKYLPVNNAYVLMWHSQIVSGPASREEILYAYRHAVGGNLPDLPAEVRRGDYTLSSLTLSRRSALPGWRITVERGPHGQFRGVGHKTGTRVTLQGPWRASSAAAETACATAIRTAHHKYGLARRSQRSDYPGLRGPANRYELRLDGKLVMTGTEDEIFKYIHKHHSYSVSHALKHEGYSVRPAAGDRQRRKPRRNSRGRFTR